MIKRFKYANIRSGLMKVFLGWIWISGSPVLLDIQDAQIFRYPELRAG